MAKRYTRINWQNAPSAATPRTAENFNIMDKGIKDCDDAIGDLALLKTTAKSDLVAAINEQNDNLTTDIITISPGIILECCGNIRILHVSGGTTVNYVIGQIPEGHAPHQIVVNMCTYGGTPIIGWLYAFPNKSIVLANTNGSGVDSVNINGQVSWII